MNTSIDCCAKISSRNEIICLFESFFTLFKTILNHIISRFLIKFLIHISTPSLLTFMVKGEIFWSHTLFINTKGEI